jgi:hypothetical protein
VGQTQIEFGEEALRLPAKAAGEATVRVVGKFAEERAGGESFESWLARSGGAKTVAELLKDLDEFPTPEARPDYYIDFDEQGPFSGEVGVGECAGS